MLQKPGNELIIWIRCVDIGWDLKPCRTRGLEFDTPDLDLSLVWKKGWVFFFFFLFFFFSFSKCYFLKNKTKNPPKPSVKLGHLTFKQRLVETVWIISVKKITVYRCKWELHKTFHGVTLSGLLLVKLHVLPFDDPVRKKTSNTFITRRMIPNFLYPWSHF